MEIKQPTLIKEPFDVIPILDRYRCKSVEHFGIICLDGAHQVIGKAVLFKGGYTCTTVDPRVCLYYAIKKRSVAVIVWHNHPSGNPEPSKEDEDLTKKLSEAFKVCGMKVLDHIVVAKYQYYSFLEKGRL